MIFFYVACIKLCEWAKNWTILLLYLSNFYLLELFASKESISIIIFIFFQVDLNFLHVKVVPLKISLMCISIRQFIFIISKLHDFIKVIETIWNKYVTHDFLSLAFRISSFHQDSWYYNYFQAVLFKCKNYSCKIFHKEV